MLFNFNENFVKYFENTSTKYAHENFLKNKLSKSDMSYCIQVVDFHNCYGGVYSDSFKRHEILKEFNRLFDRENI